jgi:endoglycosylceramidase
MNGARFILEWAAVEPDDGVFDETYLDAVATRIGWLEAADIAVVLDMHEDVFGVGFASGGGDGAPLWACDASNYESFMPSNPWALENLEPGVIACDTGIFTGAALQAKFAAAWQKVAERLKGFSNVIGFDIYNEPFYWGPTRQAFEQTMLGPLYEKVVAQVRTEAPGWVAFLEPTGERNLGGTTYLLPPSFGNYVYAPHSYDTGAETGNGFDPTDAPGLIANIAALAREAKGLGGALWIGEYGGENGWSGIADYMKATYDGAGAVAASTMIWDYTKDGYGLLNYDGSEAEPLVDSVALPYPERVAGDPVSWTFDTPTATFVATYHPRSGVTAPTVLSIPARVYPNGYTVECGGCASTQSPGALTVTSVPDVDPVVVTVHPVGAPVVDASSSFDAGYPPGFAVVNAERCWDCHGPALGGMQMWPPDGGPFAPNLTPDEATGLGSWTADQISSAVLHGIGPDGGPLCATMPRYASGVDAAIDGNGAALIVGFLRSIPPVAHPAPARGCE